jgi:lipid-binding SYLF domain-containing protein
MRLARIAAHRLRGYGREGKPLNGVDDECDQECCGRPVRGVSLKAMLPSPAVSPMTRTVNMHALRCLVCLLSLTVSSAALADKYDTTISRFKQSPVARQFFASAYGYAVFPTIGKGGMIVGGAGGKGRVYQHGRVTGESTMAQASVGFQLGGQAYSQIVFFKDKSAYDEFTTNGFEFNADASAVAITLGAATQAGTSGVSASSSLHADSKKGAAAEYVRGMAVLTYAKGGLMYEAVLAGQKYFFSKR